MPMMKAFQSPDVMAAANTAAQIQCDGMVGPAMSPCDSDEELDPEWTFDEEIVTREHTKGQRRLNAATSLIKAQEYVLNNIHMKIAEDGGGNMHPRKAASASGSRSRTLPALSGTHSVFSTASSGFDGLDDHERSAYEATNVILQRKARVEEFGSRRRDIQAMEELKRKRVEVGLVEADRRCVERQKHMVEEQRRRGVASVQRANESKKVLMEFQREKLRAYESYYVRQHRSKSAGALPADPSSSKKKTSAAETVPGIGIMSEDIYRDTMKSHSTYAGTMDKWRSFEAENERRTAAHWQKLCGPNWREEHRKDWPTSDSMPKKDKGARLRWRKTICHVREANKGALAEAEAEGLSRNDSAFGGMTVDTAFFDSRNDFGNSPSSPSHTVAGWQERKDRCDNFFQDKECGAQQKWQKTAQGLNTAKKNRANLSKDTAKRCAEVLKVWDRRQQAAKDHREKSFQQSDAGLFQKYQDADMRRDEEFQRNQERLNQQAANRTEKEKDVRTTYQTRRSDLEQSITSKIAEDDAKTNMCLKQRISEHEEKVADRNHAEVCQLKIQSKNEQEEEKRDAARQEIAGKAHRVGKALPMSPTDASMQPTIYRMRSSKQAEGRKKPKERPDVGDALMKIAKHSGAQESMKKSLEAAQESAGQNSSPKGEERPQTPSTPRSPKGKRATSGREEKDAGEPDLDGSGGESEEEFLQELEVRSAKWLQDMRKKMDNSTSRF